MTDEAGRRVDGERVQEQMVVASAMDARVGPWGCDWSANRLQGRNSGPGIFARGSDVMGVPSHMESPSCRSRYLGSVLR